MAEQSKETASAFMLATAIAMALLAKKVVSKDEVVGALKVFDRGPESSIIHELVDHVEMLE